MSVIFEDFYINELSNYIFYLLFFNICSHVVLAFSRDFVAFDAVTVFPGHFLIASVL